MQTVACSYGTDGFEDTKTEVKSGSASGFPGDFQHLLPSAFFPSALHRHTGWEGMVPVVSLCDVHCTHGPCPWNASCCVVVV